MSAVTQARPIPAEIPAVTLTDITNLLRSPAHYLDGLGRQQSSYREVIESALVDVLHDPGTAGLSGLTYHDATTVRKMAQRVRDHETAADIVTRGDRGKQWTWVDPETGILCEAAADFVLMNNNSAAVRIITCPDSSSTGIRQTLSADGAMIEAALISDCLFHTTGRRIPVFYVVVENVSPHAVAVYEIDGPTIRQGQTEYKAALELLAWCRDENQWPGYQPDGKTSSISLL